MPDPRPTTVAANLEKKLRSLGFEKTRFIRTKVVAIYVKDRVSDLEKIAEKCGGTYSDESDMQRKTGSSIGGVFFEKGPYKDSFCTAKPDKSKDLTIDEQETLQGIFIATKINNPRTQFSVQDLEKYGDTSLQSRFKTANLYEKAGKDWLNASTLAAEAMHRYFSGKNYVVCQRSRSLFVDNISKQATKLIRESGKKMGLDKWNPADIWVVKKPFLSTNFKKFESIQALNEFLYEKFKKKEIIGVSLKKTKKTAKVQVFNDGTVKSYEYKGFDTGASFVKAMNGTIKFTDGSMVLRLFGRVSDIIGEINGKFAQGGKVGGGPLLQIIGDYDKSFKTPRYTEILRTFNENPTEIVEYLYTQMEKFAPGQARQITVKEYFDTIQEKQNRDAYLISKYQACDIINAFEKLPKKKQNECIKALIGYASSETEISSIFYKVS